MIAKNNQKVVLHSSGQNLMALAAEAMLLAKMLTEASGEVTPEIEKELEVNAELLARKVDNYIFIEKQFEMCADFWKEKRDTCAAMAQSFTKQIERLRDRVKYVMNEMNIKEIEGKEYRYKLGKSQGKLIIHDENLIPPDFKMVVQATVIDKEKIKAMLKDGFSVPGAKLEESGTLNTRLNS